jgi:hypothetical protein
MAEAKTCSYKISLDEHGEPVIEATSPACQEAMLKALQEKEVKVKVTKATAVTES